MENRRPETIIPSAVGDIHKPSSKIPFDMNFEFTPNVPYTINGSERNEGYGVSTTESGIQEKPSFFDTVKAEAYEFNASAELLHAGYDRYEKVDPLNDPLPSADWKPTSNPEMFYGIHPEYLPSMYAAHGPKELQQIRDRALDEQQHDENLANGSTFARIIGGIGGAVTDPISYIPIVGWTKYAKLAPTMLKASARALPGVATTAVIQSAAKQLDHVNGNLSDFVLNAGINTVFGTAIFGIAGGASLGLDKLELWNLKGISTFSAKGIDFKHIVNDAGELTGIKAFDSTGNLGAAEVSHAQTLADSSFHKSGFFKIPYAGEGLLKLKSLPYVGSPLLQMISSKSKVMNGIADRVSDHFITTENIAKGGTSPKSFEFFMKKEYSGLRSIAAQVNALHLERNGWDIKTRPVGSLVNMGLGLYNKALKEISNDVDKNGFINRDEFFDEIQRTLFTEEPSKHGAVNEAASLYRKKMDDTYKAYRKAYNLPEDWLPPATAEGYLMRVYDTQYMNVNQGKWVDTISNWLKESDETISNRMVPITNLRSQIEDATKLHLELSRSPNAVDKAVKQSSDKIEKMRRDLRYHEENLQNELRSNQDLQLHVEDWNALSANEAKELESVLAPLNKIQKEVDEQQKIVSDLKKVKSSKKQAQIKGKTAETAKKHAAIEDQAVKQLKVEEDKLNELRNKHIDEEYNLYSMARDGQINPRLYHSTTYKFKDINDRLKFRDVYNTHIERENHARAYFDTIMNQTPEDTIAQVMGKLTGNSSENHLKSRTLLVPDELLYNNNFMTKDLHSKVTNYVTYLSRRTHLKNVFNDVTHDGGFEPILEQRNLEYKSDRAPLDLKKDELENQLKLAQNEDKKKIIEKEIKDVEKQINAETARFKGDIETLNKVYQKMMGLRQRTVKEHQFKSIITSMTAMTNLHFLPATQIADLGGIGLQHGVWPFIRDGVYPLIESFGGVLKTKDSEALRKTAPSIHLALQDVLNGYSDKNFAMEAQPYINLGKWVGGVEKMAHFSANADLTTYIDNGLQRLSGGVIQAEFMRILHDSVAGKMSIKDSEYIRKYGIDPAKWGERMVKAFKDSQGYKTKLGGYQSKFWEWQDMEAANEFSDAVFRGVQNTIINRGMLDSPFWADNALGMIFHTFTGWGYASVNRFLVPTLQRPDAEKMLGVLFSLGTGALVSPVRRMSRGEDPYPENYTDGQKAWEAINDSNSLSAVANILSWANLISDDRLLGDLKNDKYRDRMRVGALGPVWGTANRLADIFSALSTGEMNEKDAKQMARMLPIFGSIWGYNMSQKMIENLGLPPNRRAAKAGNE